MNEAVDARAAGRSAAFVFVLSGSITLINALLPAPPGFNRLGVVLIAAICMAAAPAIWWFPWERFGVGATLWLAFGALLIIPLHNHLAGSDAYRYSIFFMVLVTWIGVWHPRWTVLRMTPLLVASYLVPLLFPRHAASSIASVGYAVPVF